jgi:transposase-like protein
MLIASRARDRLPAQSARGPKQGHRRSRSSGGHRGRAKRLVAVAVEVRGTGSGRLRLATLPDASKRSVGPWVAGNVEAGAIVHTDGWGGYAGLRDLGFDHRPVSQRWRSKERRLILPRAHRALANLKTWLQGTHRSASDKHLQVYLDEFVFRHNRRCTPMAAFQTLLGLGAAHAPSTYAEITGDIAA